MIRILRQSGGDGDHEDGEQMRKAGGAKDTGRSALIRIQVLRRNEGMIASHFSFNAALGKGSKDVSIRRQARSPGQLLAAGAWPVVSQHRMSRHVARAFMRLSPWLEGRYNVS